jgi:hypothetical protein
MSDLFSKIRHNWDYLFNKMRQSWYYLKKNNYSQRFLSIFPYFVIFVGLIFIWYSLRYPVSDLYTRISAMSAFFTVVLTGLYVVVNSKQLDMMGRQLNEMRYDRELQNQPLPIVGEVVVKIEEPRLFFAGNTPHSNTKHFAFSRYIAYFVIKNVGSFPAVCTDISACIVLPSKNDNEKQFVINASSKRIDVLEEKEVYPKDGNKASFGFTGDHDGFLIKRLMDRAYEEIPLFRIRVLYKNVLGAYFVIFNDYYLSIPDDSTHKTVLKNWISNIVSFPVAYSDELKKLNSLFFHSSGSQNKEDWHDFIGIVQKQFYDSLLHIKADEDSFELDMEPLSDGFSIKPISESDYKSYLEDVQYGKVG